MICDKVCERDEAIITTSKIVERVEDRKTKRESKEPTNKIET